MPPNQIPPQDQEAEMKLLCSCIVAGEVFGRFSPYNKISHIVCADDFYDRRHVILFNAIRLLSEENLPVDYMTLRNQLVKMGKLNDIGGESYISTVGSVISHSNFIQTFAETVKQLSVRRKSIELLVKESNILYDKKEEKKLGEYLQDVVSGIVSLQNSLTYSTNLSTFESIREGLQEALIDDDEQGYLTGFTTFDDLTCGLQPSTLSIIAAAPGVGKTDVILNWALHISQQIPALIFEMEVGKKSLKQRLAALMTRVDSADIKRKRVKGEMKTFIKNGDFTGRNVFVDYSTNFNALDLRAKIAAFVSIYGKCIVFLDHVQLLGYHTKFNSDEKNESAKTAELKRISKDFDIPIVVLNHITKEGMKNSRPKLQDNKYAGAGDVDLALFLWREDSQDTSQNISPFSTLEFLIRKNRSGRCGTVYVGYDVTTGIMHELTDQKPPQKQQPEQTPKFGKAMKENS